MTNQMKALAKTAPGPGLDMIRAPVPDIGPDDVLIRIRKTGICGTDIHIWDWDDWAARTVPVPLITGHEFAGEIVELGVGRNRISPCTLVLSASSSPSTPSETSSRAKPMLYVTRSAATPPAGAPPRSR